MKEEIKDQIWHWRIAFNATNWVWR